MPCTAARPLGHTWPPPEHLPWPHQLSAPHKHRNFHIPPRLLLRSLLHSSATQGSTPRCSAGASHSHIIDIAQGPEGKWLLGDQARAAWWSGRREESGRLSRGPHPSSARAPPGRRDAE